MPARKAPSAIETPKTIAEPTAMPNATTRIVRVKSSREWVAATRPSSHGMTRPPTRNVNATSAAIFRSASRSSTATPPGEEACDPNRSGSRTRMTTVNRSSITSQPTAM